MSVVTVWRLEETTLREVLRVRSVCDAFVDMPDPEHLRIGVPCYLPKRIRESGEKVSIGEDDPVWRDQFIAILRRIGNYAWDGRVYTFTETVWR
ncbi:MAG: hypothetical protein R3B07_20035 [Polyangiaceae bacterium]